MALPCLQGWSGLYNYRYNEQWGGSTVVSSDGNFSFELIFHIDDLYVNGEPCHTDIGNYLEEYCTINFDATCYNLPAYDMFPNEDCDNVWYQASCVWIGSKPNLSIDEDFDFDEPNDADDEDDTVSDLNGTVYDQNGTGDFQNGTVNDQNGTVNDQNGAVDDLEIKIEPDDYDFDEDQFKIETDYDDLVVIVPNNGTETIDDDETDEIDSDDAVICGCDQFEDDFNYYPDVTCQSGKVVSFISSDIAIMESVINGESFTRVALETSRLFVYGEQCNDLSQAVEIGDMLLYEGFLLPEKHHKTGVEYRVGMAWIGNRPNIAVETPIDDLILDQ